MIADIVMCGISFVLGGLFTVALLHKDIFKVNRISRAEMDMISTLFKDSGDGRQVDGISQDILDIYSAYSCSLGSDRLGSPDGQVDDREVESYKIPK